MHFFWPSPVHRHFYVSRHVQNLPIPLKKLRRQWNWVSPLSPDGRVVAPIFHIESSETYSETTQYIYTTLYTYLSKPCKSRQFGRLLEPSSMFLICRYLDLNFYEGIDGWRPRFQQVLEQFRKKCTTGTVEVGPLRHQSPLFRMLKIGMGWVFAAQEFPNWSCLQPLKPNWIGRRIWVVSVSSWMCCGNSSPAGRKSRSTWDTNMLKTRIQKSQRVW